jgi:hypothetical protein
VTVFTTVINTAMESANAFVTSSHLRPSVLLAGKADSLPREHLRGKYHCTVGLLFDWFGISCMTIDNFCFYLQNRLILPIYE